MEADPTAPLRLAALQDRADELGFAPQEEVRWLAPLELARTAVKVGLSSLFADYADRREVQAALPSHQLTLPPDPDGGGWLDFVADLGDGFDPTYTVAWMLSAAELAVTGEPSPLPRGRLLVLGGDEVYPTPSATGYEDRMKGPYRAALPDADPMPLMVALPGNHDWYDGLTAFLRLFAQGRPIGGWRTEQTRSYWAIQLPARWWLVGLDTQLGTYIDGPQIRYFREHLSAHLQPGDGVIVCAPTPTWVHTGEDDPDAFNSLHFFEREVVRTRPDDDGATVETGARVRLWITGDRHHYARYAEDLPAQGAEPGGAGSADGAGPDGAGSAEGAGSADGAARQLVTCGLGGAYLLDTHRLPPSLDLPSPRSRMAHKDDPAHFRLATTVPDAATSRRLVAGLFAPPPRGLPFRNPGFLRLVGGVHAALLLVLVSVLGAEQSLYPVPALRLAGVPDVLRLAWQAGIWLLAAVLIACLAPVVRGRAPRRPPGPLAAVLLQLVVAFAALTVVVWVPWPPSWPDWTVLGVAVLGSVFGSGLVGSYAFAAYLFFARSQLVRGWQLSAQAIEDCKGFVRIRIDDDGMLTLYPVLVDRVCHDWLLTTEHGSTRSRPVPASPLAPRLAEPPVRVARTPPAGRAG